MTADVVETLLAACPFDHRLADLRDRALLLIAFASGGRRRSEVARLRVDDVVREPPIPLDPKDPDSPLVPKLAIRLGRTKTTAAEDDARVVVIGRAAQALLDWLDGANISKGAVFRRIDRWGRMGGGALDPQSINAVLKTRCQRAGLDPLLFSAHGLRSGFMTEAGRRGYRCPRPCGCPSTAPCSRRRATITKPSSIAAWRFGSSDQVGRHARYAGPLNEQVTGAIRSWKRSSRRRPDVPSRPHSRTCAVSPNGRIGAVARHPYRRLVPYVPEIPALDRSHSLGKSDPFAIEFLEERLSGPNRLGIVFIAADGVLVA